LSLVTDIHSHSGFGSITNRLYRFCNSGKDPDVNEHVLKMMAGNPKQALWDGKPRVLTTINIVSDWSGRWFEAEFQGVGDASDVPLMKYSIEELECFEQVANTVIPPRIVIKPRQEEKSLYRTWDEIRENLGLPRFGPSPAVEAIRETGYGLHHISVHGYIAPWKSEDPTKEPTVRQRTRAEVGKKVAQAISETNLDVKRILTKVSRRSLLAMEIQGRGGFK